MSSGSNQSKIISALESLVEKSRIVFWYDETGGCGDIPENRQGNRRSASRGRNQRNMNVEQVEVIVRKREHKVNEALDESDFSDYKAAGNIISDTRRHIIGENLTPDPSVKTWRSEDVGLKPGKDIQIAKGMNRMRKQGSGSKFVHGGALQIAADAGAKKILLPVADMVKIHRGPVV